MGILAGGWRRALGGGGGAGDVHFVTWRLVAGQRPLSPPERAIVCDALRRGDADRYRLFAYVVMDDHVHVLVEPISVGADRLVESWKSFAGHQLQRLHGRRAPVWEEEARDTVVRGREELRVRAEYIVGNPWKRWPFVRGYPWVWEAVPEGRGR